MNLFGETTNYKLYGSGPAVILSIIGFILFGIYSFNTVLATYQDERDSYSSITHVFDFH